MIKSVIEHLHVDKKYIILATLSKRCEHEEWEFKKITGPIIAHQSTMILFYVCQGRGCFTAIEHMPHDRERSWVWIPLGADQVPLLPIFQYKGIRHIHQMDDLSIGIIFGLCLIRFQWVKFAFLFSYFPWWLVLYSNPWQNYNTFALRNDQHRSAASGIIII